MFKRLLGGFVVTAAMSLVAPAQEVRFETLEMRYHWEAPHAWLVDIAKDKRPVKKSKKVKAKAKRPLPPTPTYQRIA